MQVLTILLCLIVALMPLRADAAATGGYVTLTRSGCDYFLVSTRCGYVVMEWYSGAEPDDDGLIFGTDNSFHTYGFHDVYDKNQERGIHVWVEDYDLNADEAIDKINEECE